MTMDTFRKPLTLKTFGICKIWIFFLAFWALMAVVARAATPDTVARAATPGTVARAATLAPLDDGIEIRLDGQLWWRPADPKRNLEFKRIGDGQGVEVYVDRANPTATAEVRVGEGELRATVKFFLVFPKPSSGDLPYVSVQTRIFHPEAGFIAECANFDPIRDPAGIGVGVCSGVVRDRQFGVTLSKVRR